MLDELLEQGCHGVGGGGFLGWRHHRWSLERALTLSVAVFVQGIETAEDGPADGVTEMNTAEVPSGHPYAHPLEVAVAGRDFKANPTQTDGAIGTALGADQFVCENQLEIRRGGWTGPA